MLLRVLILVLSVSVAAPVARAEETLGQALKKIFSTPTPTPHRKKKTASATPTKKKSPTPTATASASPKKKHSPASEESPTASPSSSPKQIKGFENYPLKVQKLLTSALELTTRNLDYKYGSADPASGGMDCSGFVYYVLKQNEVPDVPRDSSQQYSWLRHARTFEAVMS